jgi:glutamyl-Q tRNA(Asp) synthetase
MLHLGNALAFGAAWLSARNAGGRLLYRLEDLDSGRARAEVAEAQRADLRWLGIDWDEEVVPQSRRAYDLARVPTYRCPCTRATRLYLGCTCRHKEHDRGAWRFRVPPGPVAFTDRARGAQSLESAEDPILVRADGGAAYPLAVVVDDARDGVTEVVRGADLLEATPVQIRLQECLDLPRPSYLHVPILVGPDRRKLSKSHGAPSVRDARAAGVEASRLWAYLLPLLGIEPGPLRDAVLDPCRVPAGPHVVDPRGVPGG